MKTYKDFLEEEFRAEGFDVDAAMDYVDHAMDEIERAAVKYSIQNSDEMLTDIGRVIYNSDKSPQERVNDVKDLLAFKYRK
jgi:hypothetical protein